MNAIANQAKRAPPQSPADPEQFAPGAEHQRARRAARRGLLWLGLIYLGFLGGGVGIAVDQIVRPLGL
ncbi:MAG TPA: hypothetical protein VFN42_15060 [Acetobacteraceae bacterium]|nr:hypothetical protein [Acetobacteraceae bacterium]